MGVTKRHRNLFVAAAVLTYLLVTLGGVVCVTDSSRGCPDWPACYGRLLPPPRLNSILEYTHRAVAGLTSLLIVAAAVVGRRRYRPAPWLWRPLAAAVAFLTAVIVFGALVVLRGLEPGLAALDLGSALAVQALVAAAAVAAVVPYRNPARAGLPALDGNLARLALWTAIATWVVLVSGVLVAESGSAVRCLSWPLYGGEEPSRARPWLQGMRQIAGGLAAALIAALVFRSWRVPHQRRAIRPAAAVVGALLLAELAVGALLAAGGEALWLQVVHVALAAALWASLCALLALAALPSPAPAECASRY